MLGMDRVHVIRHKVLEEGQSIRRVAQEMGLSRVTVRRYLRKSEPKREEYGPRARPVTARVGPAIEELLDSWKGRTTAKQRVTARRVHEELVTMGYVVGGTTVKSYLAERRLSAAEVFVPLIYRPGELAEVDFFEVTVEVAGQMKKAWKFLVRLMWSGKDFAYLYERCDQVSFLDGHIRAFAHFGGVPLRMAYDNLSAAVKRRVGAKRELTDRMKALCSHYLFEACFARPGEGHDKGGVEARGRGIRLQHLVPVPRGESLDEISQWLLERLDKQAERRPEANGASVQERFEKEREFFRDLPPKPFEARRQVLVDVSPRSLVKVEGAVYSISEECARRPAQVLVGPSAVTILCRGHEVTHAKQPFGGRSVLYMHFLRELSRKPQALRQVAEPLMQELGSDFVLLWKRLVGIHGELDAARAYTAVLRAIKERGLASVTRAVGAALAADRLDLLELAPVEKRAPVMVLVPAALSGIEIESGSAASYDALLGTGAGWLQ